MGNATNVRTMQARGHVVWIDPPFEVILERLRANPGGRPLLATMGDPFDEEVLRAHFAQRQSAYAKSGAVGAGRSNQSWSVAASLALAEASMLTSMCSFKLVLNVNPQKSARTGNER